MLKILDSENGGSRVKLTPSSLNFNVKFSNLVHVWIYKLLITGQNWLTQA